VNALFLCSLVLIPNPAAESSDSESALLQGTWIAVATFDGDGKPAAIKPGDPRSFTLTFRDKKLIVQRRDGRLEALYRLESGHQPGWIDVTRKVRGKPTTFLGIYELSGQHLRLCLGGPNGAGPAARPTAFKHSEDIEIAVELRREK
jgi:uncharacterized protein (TIGR03067 family)